MYWGGCHRHNVINAPSLFLSIVQFLSGLTYLVVSDVVVCSATLTSLSLVYSSDPFITFLSVSLDSSGANEAMSRMASMTSSQIFNRQFLRSRTVLFGIGEERPYSIEKSPALLVARLKHNVSLFYLNYLMVLVVLFCLTLLTSPMSIMVMILLGAAWFYVIRHTQQSGNIIVYGTSTPMVVCCTNEDTGCCCCGEEGLCVDR
jgi:hypothetical protein